MADKACSLMVVGLCCLLLAGNATGESREREARLRAAYIYNFIKFIKWPRDHANADSDRYLVCMVGEVFYWEAVQSLENKSLRRRSIVTQVIDQESDVASCHVLIVGLAGEGLQVNLLEGLKRVPVVTIGDIDAFSEIGGMIRFYLNDADRLQFEINIKRVRFVGVTIGSNLLRLAKVTQ